jgi:hypothetical protein
MFSRKKIVGLALSLTLLAGSGGAFAAQQADYDRISGEMAGLRNLELLHPLDISTQNRDELRQWLVDSIEQDFPEVVQERDQRVMVVFGLIEPGTDLGQLELDLLGEQIAGYYDPETGEMVVVSSGTEGDSLSASDELTFAHEVVHALQDQHFDLLSVQGDSELISDDEYLAVGALIEGDATVGQVQYMVAHPMLILGLQRELDDLDTSVLDNAPSFISGTLLFPYDQGATFVTALYEEGGWDLVNDAYTNVPQSTEQILHPEKYLAGEAPIQVTVNDPLPTLGNSWSVLEVNTFGEYIIQSFLDSGEVRPGDAQAAAEGWGGDQYVVAGTEDETALVWSTEWDSEEHAAEFFKILSTHETKRFNAEKTDNSSDLLTQFAYVDGAGEIRLDGTSVIYVLAPDQEMVASLFDNQHGSGKPAAALEPSPEVTPAS